MTNIARTKRQSAAQPQVQTQTKGETTMTKKQNIKGFIKDMVITYLLATIIFMVLEDGSNAQLFFPFMTVVLGTLLSCGNYQARKGGK